MIAAWMLFSVMTGALLIVLGMLLESLARRTKRPTRMIWLALMVAALVMPLRSAFDMRDDASEDRANAPTTQQTSGVTTNASNVVARSAEGQPALTVSDRVSVAVQRARVVVQRAGVTVGLWIERASRYDGVLLSAWFALSTACVVLVCVTIVRDRRSLVVRSTDSRDGLRVRYTHTLGPAATGIFAPRILVPLWVRELAPEARAMVLLHESEHLRTRDPLVVSIGIVAIVLAPWHLPLWMMLARLRAAIEIDCDARVLRVWPNVRGYASLLLHIAERSQNAPVAAENASRAAWSNRLQPLRISMASGRIAIERRIRVMTKRRTRRNPTAVIGTSVATFAAGALLFVLPVPPTRAIAQSTTATRATPPRRFEDIAHQSLPFDSLRDRVVAFVATPRYDKYAGGRAPKGGITALASGLEDFNLRGAVISIAITTASGRDAFIERSREGFRPDTVRMRVPMQLVYVANADGTYLRSLNGDTLIVAEFLNASPFPPARVRGTRLHIIANNARVLIGR